MRFRVISALATILVLAMLPAPGHADTLTTFNLIDVTFDGSPNLATGTVVIDSTTGEYVSANINYTIGSTIVTFTSPRLFTATQSGNERYTQIWDTTLAYEITLDLPGDLIGYTGGLLCTTASKCPSNPGTTVGGGAFGGGSVQMLTGSLVPVSLAATPEPSTFLMLGTGLLAAGGALRKRLIS